MRDAFGGAFMIQLFLIFIIIYIGFTAIALNYAKAFKVKNKVIDYLESSEITDLDSMDAATEEILNQYFDEEILGNMNYNLSSMNICDSIEKKDYSGKTVAYCHDSGIIIRQTGSATNTEGVYYTVSTFVGWSIPFLNKLLEFGGNNQEDVVTGLWEISGQTRLIVNG